MRDFKKFMIDLRLQFEESDAQLLQANTKFRDLGTFDSLTRFSIVAYIDDEYNFKLPDNIFTIVQTPQELFNFMSNE